MKIKAKYVSMWDGDTPIESNCIYDTETNKVTDVEQVDTDGMDIDILTDEFVVLPDGTMIDRADYLLEDEDF